MTHHRSFRDFDWTLLAITLAICGLGVLQIYSATHDSSTWRDSWWKQIIWICVGLALMWIVTQIDYHSLLAQVPLFYILSVLGLAATFVLGKTVFGARRWVGIGGFHLQVSEFVKIVIVLLVARYLSERKSYRTLAGRDLLKLGGLVGLPLVIVMAQPDLGTSLTYVPILLIGVFLAGLRVEVRDWGCADPGASAADRMAFPQGLPASPADHLSWIHHTIRRAGDIR